MAVAVSATALIALTGCSEEVARLGLPVAASEEAPNMGDLWIGAWIASMVIGGLVWGLIGWAVIRYRRREGDAPAPRQTKYHLPLELLYTLVPFLIIGVLFFYTVQAHDNLISQEGEPDTTIGVIGQKWSWTFNYMEEDNPDIGTVAHDGGTPEVIPDLYLPVDKKVRFNLNSADVIHSFWIPSFYFKMDVIPGHPNSFDVTPNRLGDYVGKCAELCGTYHSQMIFNVRVVTEEEYNAKVLELAASGNDSEIKIPETSIDLVPSFDPQEEQQ
ncbi:MAG: aa3-type cytochrome oxidase subunit II [Arachnia sp.]